MNYMMLIVAILSLVIGYFWGRYIGQREGFKEGFLLTPLYLRKKSLDQGNCVLCNSKSEDIIYQQESHS